MMDAGIFEGDIAVVRQQSVAEDGDIVVALREDAATIKYFKKDGKGFYLKPANSRFKIIPAKGFRIIGKVVSIIRKY